MRQKVAKKIRKVIYGDYSYALHNDNNPNPLTRKKNREMGIRLRKQYRQAKKEHNQHAG